MRLIVYILTFFVCCSVRCLAVSDMSSTDECKQLLKKGNEAFNEDRFDIALDLYTKCLELADINGDLTNYTSALGSIGNLYGLFQDYDRAAYYFEKGYKASLQQDQRLQSIFLTNLVMCCSYAGNAEKTHAYYEKLRAVPTLAMPKRHMPITRSYDICPSGILNSHLIISVSAEQH